MQDTEFATFAWKGDKLRLSTENGLLSTHYVDMYV
jgi:hypothetical protein